MRVLWSWLVYTWGGLHRYFGNTNNMSTEHEAAVRYFTRAYEINPAFYQARLARGILLYRELGQLDEAKADFDALLKIDPDYGAALFNRAMVAEANGRYQDALNDLETYLTLKDDEYIYEAQRLIILYREVLDEEE